MRYRKPIISIIGGGRVGKTFGKLFIQNKVGILGGVYNRTKQNAEKACEFIGAGILCESISQIPRSDIIFITTPDRYIESACNELVSINHNQNNNLTLLHCSGSRTADLLIRGKKHFKALTAAVHPIHSFGNPEQAVNNFPGTICSFQGDKELYPDAKDLFLRLGAAHIFELSAENKAAYHASGMFPGCLTVALMKVAQKLYLDGGVPKEIATRIIGRLLSITAQNLQNTSIENVPFNGSLPRGDIETLESHLKALSKSTYLNTYQTLMNVLLEDIKDQNFAAAVHKLFNSRQPERRSPTKLD